jgi:hypothetical protein
MGFEPKTRNRALVAQFRVRRMKRRQRTVRRGGVEVGWWGVRGGCGGGVVRLRNARRGRGLSQKDETELPWLGFGCAA